MKREMPTGVDFETEAIKPRPDYPPLPVGVSIKAPGDRQPRYLAWGHPTGNNCSMLEAALILKQLWASGDPLLFHNSKFDLDVAETHFDLAPPPWHLVEDTLYLLFLDDPHSTSLELKPASVHLLGMPAEERDELQEWILANIPGATKSTWGAHIANAPADIVGRYANSDVDRTLKLWKLLRKKVHAAGMDTAYDRERRLQPYLLANERTGLRVDMPRLHHEIPIYQFSFAAADAWLRKRLKAPDINIDSNAELVEALLRVGAADASKMLRTPKTGELSTSKESLLLGVSDLKISRTLGYRSRLATCLNTFMLPWQRIGENNAGRIHTSWRQVRSGHGKDTTGARTGRLIAAEPNLLNLAKTFEDRDDGYEHPDWLDLPVLPLVRRYILPEKGHVFGHRDYNQQELRVFAHYEDGALKAAYLADPTLDVHNFVRDEVKRLLDRDVPRRPIKILNFGMLYGMGLDATARKMNTNREAADELKRAQRKVIPGAKAMYDDMKQRARDKEPIRTWGGRLYYCELPTVRNGRISTLDYKLVNYLVQGSASDITKEATIRYHENPRRKEGRFLVTVYDEENASMPKKALREEMAALKESMESIELDVPMLSDAKVGPNWGELTKYAD